MRKHASYTIREHRRNPSRGTSGRNTNTNTSTSLFADAPDPAATRRSCNRARLPLAGWSLRVRCTVREGVAKTSLRVVHSIDQGVPDPVTDSGALQEIAALYPQKVAWHSRWVQVAQRIFLQYVSYSRQYAECQITENPGICLKNCMPDILQGMIA